MPALMVAIGQVGNGSQRGHAEDRSNTSMTPTKVGNLDNIKDELWEGKKGEGVGLGGKSMVSNPTQRPKQSCPCDQLLPESGAESPHSPTLQAIRLGRKSPVHMMAPTQQSILNTKQRNDLEGACSGPMLDCDLIRKPTIDEKMEMNMMKESLMEKVKVAAGGGVCG